MRSQKLLYDHNKTAMLPELQMQRCIPFSPAAPVQQRADVHSDASAEFLARVNSVTLSHIHIGKLWSCSMHERLACLRTSYPPVPYLPKLTHSHSLLPAEFAGRVMLGGRCRALRTCLRHVANCACVQNQSGAIASIPVTDSRLL